MTGSPKRWGPQYSTGIGCWRAGYRLQAAAGSTASSRCPTVSNRTPRCVLIGLLGCCWQPNHEVPPIATICAEVWRQRSPLGHYRSDYWEMNTHWTALVPIRRTRSAVAAMRAMMQAILWRLPLPRSALNAHGHCMCNASSNKVPAHDRNTMALRDEPHQIDAPQKQHTLSKSGLRKFTLPDAAAAADDVRRACRHIAKLPMLLSSESWDQCLICWCKHQSSWFCASYSLRGRRKVKPQRLWCQRR